MNPFDRGRGRGSNPGRGGRGSPHKSGRGSNQGQSSGSKPVITMHPSDPRYDLFAEQWNILVASRTGKFTVTPPPNSQLIEHDASFASVLESSPVKEVAPIQLPTKEHILFLEPVDLQWEKDPWYLMDKYLQAWAIPHGSNRHRGILQTILSLHGCEFTNFFQNAVTKSGPINYSKCYFQKIIFPHEWGLSPFIEKKFSQKGVS